MINITGNASDWEKDYQLSRLEEEHGQRLAKLDVSIDPEDGNYLLVNYEFAPTPFERIRRITGYLVGTMDHWNDAKRAEERDRVKHF